MVTRYLVWSCPLRSSSIAQPWNLWRLWRGIWFCSLFRAPFPYLQLSTLRGLSLGFFCIAFFFELIFYSCHSQICEKCGSAACELFMFCPLFWVLVGPLSATGMTSFVVCCFLLFTIFHSCAAKSATCVVWPLVYCFPLHILFCIPVAARSAGKASFLYAILR